MPVYDMDSMASVAGQVDKIKDEIEKSKAALTPMEGENPFGELAPPEGKTDGGAEDAKNSIGDFHKGVHSEFDAASGHMSAASDFLRRAVGLLKETEDVHSDNLKVHYNNQEQG